MMKGRFVSQIDLKFIKMNLFQLLYSILLLISYMVDKFCKIRNFKSIKVLNHTHILKKS
jgi:hypothetical protein